MGVDAKAVVFFAWKSLSVFMEIVSRFAGRHSFSSGILLFVIILYIFLPSVFYFSVCSSPVLLCMAFYARAYVRAKRLEIGNGSEQASDQAEKICTKPLLSPQRSVRRNGRRRVEEAKEWESRNGEDQKEKVILTTLYNDLLGWTPHFEESPKSASVEEAGNAKSQRQQVMRLEPSFGDLVSLGGGGCASDCGNRKDEMELRRNEASNIQEREDVEVERIRRLENLIVRRRARRSLKLRRTQKSVVSSPDKGSPSGQIPSSRVARNPGLDDAEGNPDKVDGLRAPVSAPCMLLPAQNPFDIPYDPQEEKPNLTGDSFDQEFSSILDSGDLSLTQQESFRCAGIPSEHIQDADLDSSSKINGLLGPRTPLDIGDDDNQESSREVNPTKLPKGSDSDTDDEKLAEAKTRRDLSDRQTKSGYASEVQTEIDRNDDDETDTSSSDESESEFKEDFNRGGLSEELRRHAMEKLGANRTKSSSPMPICVSANNDIPPHPEIELGYEQWRFDDNHFYTRRGLHNHTRTFSIASDMQVEISEMESLPTTDCENNSSDDGAFSFQKDVDGNAGHDPRVAGMMRESESKPRMENTQFSDISKALLDPTGAEEVHEDLSVTGKVYIPETTEGHWFNNQGEVEELLEHVSSSSSPAPSQIKKPETPEEPVADPESKLGDRIQNFKQESLSVPDCAEKEGIVQANWGKKTEEKDTENAIMSHGDTKRGQGPENEANQNLDGLYSVAPEAKYVTEEPSQRPISLDKEQHGGTPLREKSSGETTATALLKPEGHIYYSF